MSFAPEQMGQRQRFPIVSKSPLEELVFLLNLSFVEYSASGDTKLLESITNAIEMHIIALAMGGGYEEMIDLLASYVKQLLTKRFPQIPTPDLKPPGLVKQVTEHIAKHIHIIEPEMSKYMTSKDVEQYALTIACEIVFCACNAVLYRFLGVPRT